MKKKIIIAVIIAAVLTAAAGAGFLFFKSRPPKAPKGTGSFVAKQYYIENGKKKLVSVTREYFDERGNLIYANDDLPGERNIIFRFEYDDLNRITVQKEMNKTLFGESPVETVYYKYDGDSERVSEKKTVTKDGSTVWTYQYDEEGRCVGSRCGADYSTESVYNEKGVEISKIIHDKDLVLIEKEYNEKTREIFCYEKYYQMQKDYSGGKTGNLNSIILLGEDGRIAEESCYRINDDSNGTLTLYARYVYTYYTDEEELDYEEKEYNKEGVLEQQEVVDKKGRTVIRRYYEDGAEKGSMVTEYDAERPEYPKQKVEITKHYQRDGNGEMVPVSENHLWRSGANYPFQSVIAAEKSRLVVRWDTAEAGTRADSVFSDDGVLKEWRGYNDDGSKTIHYYDGRGNWIKAENYDTNGKITSEYVVEYKYY